MIVNRLARVVALLFALCAASDAAFAVCNINGAGMSMTPGTANSGTYTPPNAPASVPVAVTITGTYSTNATGGTCTLALSFQRASYPPATMARSGGGSTLTYTISSGTGGTGNVLLFTGTTVSLANVLQYSFASAGNNITNRAFTANLTIYVTMQPTSNQQAGSYTDNLTAWVFNLASGSSVYSRAFSVTGTVNKACTIGGVYTPAADSASIPVSSAGAVNTATINKSYSTVQCNTPSNVQLTSQNGAVRNTGTAPSGFSNQINYSATATFSGATASINTATNTAATGPESGTAVSTTGTTPTGSLAVAITPQTNVQRLIAGSYGDVLTITIVPQ